ncbi:hypothetical protein [Undibacterium curvum]|uniref:hypothetical protein n=1 Tax=Undibacterium curvum TaxID=2762294 RepID=UPI003D0DFF62
MEVLLQLIKAKYPNDAYICKLDEALHVSTQARAIFRAYDKALDCLDQSSWEILSQKAIDHFFDHRSGQLKQGFYNQLNEAFAYKFLLRQGYSHVSILRENGKTTPDLSYCCGTEIRYCEVKSIGISEEEIDRLDAGDVFNGSVYFDLSAGFMRKLDADIKLGYKQIASKGTEGIVFIVANLDDFTLTHYERYRMQIAEHLSKVENPEVYVMVGLLGGRKIHHRVKKSQGTS